MFKHYLKKYSIITGILAACLALYLAVTMGYAAFENYVHIKSESYYADFNKCPFYEIAFLRIYQKICDDRIIEQNATAIASMQKYIANLPRPTTNYPVVPSPIKEPQEDTPVSMRSNVVSVADGAFDACPDCNIIFDHCEDENHGIAKISIREKGKQPRPIFVNFPLDSLCDFSRSEMDVREACYVGNTWKGPSWRAFTLSCGREVFVIVGKYQDKIMGKAYQISNAEYFEVDDNSVDFKVIEFDKGKDVFVFEKRMRKTDKKSFVELTYVDLLQNAPILSR